MCFSCKSDKAQNMDIHEVPQKTVHVKFNAQQLVLRLKKKMRVNDKSDKAQKMNVHEVPQKC